MGNKEIIEKKFKSSTCSKQIHEAVLLVENSSGDFSVNFGCGGKTIIILGAIGPVFGDYFSTLTKLSACLDPVGIFIIDDGYIENTSDYNHPLILKQEIIHKQIESSGMKLIDEVIIPRNSIKDSDDYIFENLEKRCKELIIKLPCKKHLFENYIKKQKEENYILENVVICSTMVIKRLLT